MPAHFYCLKIPRITSVTNPTINRPVKICSKCSRTYPQTKMQSTAHMTAFINLFILRSPPPKMNRNFHLFFFVVDEIKTGQNSVLFLFHQLHFRSHRIDVYHERLCITVSKKRGENTVAFCHPAHFCTERVIQLRRYAVSCPLLFEFSH